MGVVLVLGGPSHSPRSVRRLGGDLPTRDPRTRKRQNGSLFVCALGHELEERGLVVERTTRFVVAERPEAAPLALSADEAQS
jgi:hypothetical protein